MMTPYSESNLLLALTLLGCVSVSVTACGKDILCQMTYCGNPCGSMLYFGSQCRQCEKDEYFDDEFDCRCKLCTGKFTNNSPNIRSDCMDPRKTTTSTITRTPQSSSLQMSDLPTTIFLPPTQTATAAPSTIPTTTKTTITADTPYTSEHLPNDRMDPVAKTTMPLTQVTGRTIPSPTETNLVPIVLACLGGLVLVLVASLAALYLILNKLKKKKDAENRR